MKLFVHPNIYTIKQIEIAKKAITLLKNKFNYEVSISREDSLIMGNEELFTFDISSCDYIVSLGGDGCALETARLAIKYNKPLLAINAGHVGYLCAISLSDLDELDEDIFKNVKFEERSVLDVREGENIYHAINDAVVGKMNFGKMITVTYRINDEDKVTFKGDGYIVSTPLGSTGYVVSAGGDIVSEDAKKICVAPICPQFLKVKPRVLDDNSVVTLYARFSHENKTGLFIDGVNVGEVTDDVIVSLSNKKLTIGRKKK